MVSAGKVSPLFPVICHPTSCLPRFYANHKEDFARANFLDSHEQLFPDHPIVPKLIFWNADDHYSNSEPGKILLKLKLAVNRHEHVELVLSDGQ